MENRIGRRGAALLAMGAAIGALALPSAASAAVPRGEYACYGETATYIGTLKVKSTEKYSYLGENGKYRFKSGPKVLRFKSGALKPWVGKLLKADGKPMIELTTDEAGGQIVNCYKS